MCFSNQKSQKHAIDPSLGRQDQLVARVAGPLHGGNNRLWVEERPTGPGSVEKDGDGSVASDHHLAGAGNKKL